MFRSVPYRVSLFLLPLVAAIAAPMLGRGWYYMSDSGSSVPESLRWSISGAVHAVGTGGVWATVFIIVGNAISVAAIILTAIIVSYYWSARRVYLFLVVAMLAVLIVWWRTSPELVVFRTEVNAIDRPSNSWSMHILQYDTLGLLAIPVALVMAALPIWGTPQRELIRRGLCPKCRYTLGKRIDAGCPECGWKRSDRA